ncbi:hypothetical protein J4409_03165 [Candidatus Woesearchaeota archaeon]|nr:hypothetical protein [Candidatus Woesearchaeota archaeon]
MFKSLKDITLNSLLSIILKIALIILFPYLIYKQQYLFALSALIAIILSLIPAMLKRNYNINLPWGIDFLITFALYLHTLGLTFKWYKTIPYYDILTHVLGTVVIALLGFIIVYTLHFTRKVRLSIPLIGLFTVVFAIAVGSLWEIGEFATDKLLGTEAQRGNFDTMKDLIFDTLAGIVTAIAAMFYVRYAPKYKLSEIIHPFDMLLSIKNKKRFSKLVLFGNGVYSKKEEYKK